MGAEGYITDGFVGFYTCPTATCRAKIMAYRSVEQNPAGDKDFLRFEQAIEGGSGRCVMQVPITFEKEFVEMEKGLVSQKTMGTPCACAVVKEKFFASCKYWKDLSPLLDIIHIVEWRIGFLGAEMSNTC